MSIHLYIAGFCFVFVEKRIWIVTSQSGHLDSSGWLGWAHIFFIHDSLNCELIVESVHVIHCNSVLFFCVKSEKHVCLCICNASNKKGQWFKNRIFISKCAILLIFFYENRFLLTRVKTNNIKLTMSHTFWMGLL